MTPTNKPATPDADHSTNARRVTHDQMFRFITADQARCLSLLMPHLPVGTDELVDTDRLPETEEATFFDSGMRATIGDRLLRLHLKRGNPNWCHVLIEHKSRPDRRAALQVNRYAMHVLERHLERQDWPVPIVLTAIFHFGARPWEGPRELLELRRAPEALRRSAFNFRTIFVDFTSLDPDKMAADPLTGGMCRALLLGRRGTAGDDELAAVLGALPFDDPIEHRVHRYLVSNLGDLTEQRLNAILKTIHHPERRKTVATLADQWYAEGRTSTLIETLLRLVRQRFGEVPAYAEARIRAATPGQLESWTDSVLDAEDIAAIVGKPAGR